MPDVSGRMPRILGLLVSVLLLGSVSGQLYAGEYHVAFSDAVASDMNSGTEMLPFRTLGKACAVAGPGDTVYMHAGTYRETLAPKRSGEAGKPVRFVAVAGGRVVLSGTDPLTGTWELHKGNIFRLSTPLRFVQLFVDGKMMPEARWPNATPDSVLTYSRATAGEGTGYGVLTDANLPLGDWNDGIVLIWPGQRWFSGMRRIVDYQPGKSFHFDRTFETQVKDKYHAEDPYKPSAGDPYVLIGSLDGLDSSGEWFLDEAAGILYLWTPDGDSPVAHVVEVKQRDYGCDLSALSFIEIEGVDIFGAAVNMTDSQHCLLEDCRLRYVEHFRDIGPDEPPAMNCVTGRSNEWRRCLIAYAATAALAIGGEDNCLVDSIVHSANYLGTAHGGVDLSQAVRAEVLYCTISHTGRDIVSFSGSECIRLEHNDLYQGNMLNADAGAFYCWRTDGRGSTIAYNWIHDSLTESTAGIYLDSFSSDFIVCRNVIRDCTFGIQLNSDATDHLICNNTVQKVLRPFITCAYDGYTPTMKGTRIINNLVNGVMDPNDSSQFVQGELGPELHHNGPGVVDSVSYPVPGSPSIDAGVVIEGITQGYMGEAPDIGAYEFGWQTWGAGADWCDRDAVLGLPTNLACSSPR